MPGGNLLVVVLLVYHHFNVYSLNNQEQTLIIIAECFLQVQYIDHKNLLCWKHSLIKQIAIQRYFTTTETIRTTHGDIAHLYLETWWSHKPMVVPQV